jgi:hypothetical protein
MRALAKQARDQQPQQSPLWRALTMPWFHTGQSFNNSATSEWLATISMR